MILLHGRLNVLGSPLNSTVHDGNDTASWTVEFSGDPNTFDAATVGGDNLTFATTTRESTTDMLVIKFGVAFKI